MSTAIEPASVGICDAHLHLPWESCVPRPFIDGAITNMVVALRARSSSATFESVADRVLARMQDRNGDGLVSEMDAAGIARAAMLVPDLTFALRTDGLTIEELLTHHAEVGRRHPGRFELFAGIDPRWGADGVALFERAVGEWGYRGLKVYPPAGFRPSERAMYPYYEICRQRGLPVLVHIGPTSPVLTFETAHPAMLDEACRDFGDVSFVLGHGGAVLVEECVAMAAFRPNVYLETSGFQRLGGLAGGMRHIESLCGRGINHKILFGTDHPVFQHSLADVTAALLAEGGPLEGLSAVDAELVTRLNFERLWAPLPTRRA